MVDKMDSKNKAMKMKLKGKYFKKMVLFKIIKWNIFKKFMVEKLRLRIASKNYIIKSEKLIL